MANESVLMKIDIWDVKKAQSLNKALIGKIRFFFLFNFQVNV